MARKTLGWMIGAMMLVVGCNGSEFEPGGTGGGGGAAGGAAGGQTSGGAGGAASCDDLIRRADAELQAAQKCDMSLNRISCVDTVLSLCNCPVIVDLVGMPATQAYLATKAEFEARKCPIGCPAVLCRTPGQGRCQPVDSGIIGVCVDSTVQPVLGG
jgi:hypothetical protein